MSKFFLQLKWFLYHSRLATMGKGRAALPFHSHFPFKASQIGLWPVWLAGFLLIGLSIYSTSYLVMKERIARPAGGAKVGSLSPSVTMFTCPRPFVGLIGSRQALAIRSWLAASPEIHVVLFGDNPSLSSLAGQFGRRISVDLEIDFNFLGTPFFHSVVARSRASNSDISVVIDPETVLFPDFFTILEIAHNLKHDWLLMAKTPAVSHFPFHIDDSSQQWLREDGRKIKVKKLQEFVSQKDNWRSCGTHILMAWNTGRLPLHAAVLPPFLYRKDRLYAEWLINEALASDFRFVFDASWVVSSCNLEHVLANGSKTPVIPDDGEFKEREWEYLANANLASLYGSLYFKKLNFTSKLTKLVRCNGKNLFVDMENKLAFDFEDNEIKRTNIWKGVLPRSRRDQSWHECMEFNDLVNEIVRCPMRETSKRPLSKKPLILPFSLDSLLPMVADADKSVVLAVASNNYKDMLMSWVCRLRHLHISNFVVCALDTEIYEFSVLQGLPVFMDKFAPRNVSLNNCHFGTECFQKVTKVKSRIVVQILELGYNVLLSDVDIYWFMNPLPYLYSFGPSVLVAQSDEFNETVPINLPRRLNSGFYFARSDAATIRALKRVVKHASTSNLSEQPSFYDMLCGEGGVYRVGDDKCHEPQTNLTVHFLDRSRFPNGAYRGLWEKKNVREECLKLGCVMLHNNWVNGRKRKLERQISSGLWEYDAAARICLKSWHNTTFIDFF